MGLTFLGQSVFQDLHRAGRIQRAGFGAGCGNHLRHIAALHNNRERFGCPCLGVLDEALQAH